MNLPGAAELFRSTTGDPPKRPPERRTPPPERSADRQYDQELDLGLSDETPRRPAPRRPPRIRPSGRQRHDEKITVYVSADELLDLEHTRLTLRASYGIAVDRGRLVREAVAELLEDFHANGDASTLMKRLRRDVN